jgi:hypothetical protein
VVARGTTETANVTARLRLTFAVTAAEGLHSISFPYCAVESASYGTFMIRHGLVAQEADLLCGRIPPSIFVRHYFSPAIKELKERTLKAVEEMGAKGLQ